MNNDEEGARLTRMEENRERIAMHRAEVDGSPAPSHRLVRYDLGGRGYDVYMEPDETGQYVEYEAAIQIIREQQAALVAAEDYVRNCTDSPQFADGLLRTITKWRFK